MSVSISARMGPALVARAVRVVKALSGLLERDLLAELGVRAPSVAFGYATLVGRLAHLLALGPSPDDVREVLGEMPGEAVNRIRREITIHEYENRLIEAMARRHGLESIIPLIRFRGLERLRDVARQKSGAILVFAHVGPVRSVMAGPIVVGLPLVALGRLPPVRFPSHFEVWRAAHSADQPTLFLKHAIDHLRAGGSVMLSIDGLQGRSATPVDFLGAKFGFRRGLFVLYEATRAPVVPLVTTWGSRSVIDLEVQEPLAVPDLDTLRPEERCRAFLNTTAGWLERQIRARPGDVRDLAHYLTLKRSA